MNTDKQESQSTQNAYAPYHKEAFYCLIIDIVIAVSLTLLLLLAGAGWFLLGILPLFAVCTLLINHRTALRARKECREGAEVTATWEIRKIRESVSAAGYWGMILREMFPKALHVSRCTITCRNGQGEQIVLHSIMSEAKRRLLCDAMDRGQLKQVSLTYGPRSRILLACHDRGEWADALNHTI